MKAISFDHTLNRHLQDVEFAQQFLQASLELGPDEFLGALRDAVQARGGISKCARECGVTRAGLYRMLKDGANPGLRAIHAVLRAIGLTLEVQGPAEAPGDDPGPDIMPVGTGAHGISIPRHVYTRLEKVADSQGFSAEALAQTVLASGVAVLTVSARTASRRRDTPTPDAVA